MNSKQISILFDVNRAGITKHITNIYDYEELDSSVRSKIDHTADDGKKYNIQFYNLAMIIAVGY